jgi:hypothetical protein
MGDTMKLPDNKEELHMTFEIEYLDGSPLANYVRVDASDEETALFVAGMKFSDMDLNTDVVEVLSVTNVGSRL